MSRQQLPEQLGMYFDEDKRIPRRRSATYEDIEARRKGQVPTHTQNTEEDRSVSITPRSAIRHRPIGNMYIIPFTDGSEMRVTQHELGTLPKNYQNAAQLLTPQVATPKQRREPHPKVPIEDDTVYEMPPARTHAGDTDPLPRQPRRRFPRFHFLVWVGLAMLLMIIGWVSLTYLSSWWTNQTNQWTYGYPRTYQTDYNVGHGTTQNPLSHFVALNLNRHIEVIEIPGNDPSKSKIYIGPTLIGPGEDLTPVTLSFEDVNNDGRPDLVIHVGDSKFIFLNQKDGTFKAAPNQ